MQKAKQGDAMKNNARDLERKLGKDIGCPELHWAKIAVWDEDEGCSVLIDFPFIVPHEFFVTILETIERPWKCLGHLEDGKPCISLCLVALRDEAF